MELAYTPEEQAFRNDVRDFVRARRPADIARKVLPGKLLERDDNTSVLVMIDGAFGGVDHHLAHVAAVTLCHAITETGS